MRKTSNSFKFVLRFGTMFSQISFIGILAGIGLLIHGINGHSNELPIAVALIIIGPSLLYVSILMANKKIEVVEKGKVALGTFKEWKNSFIIRNNQTLVYLFYTYYDDKRKKKEAYTLSGNSNAREKMHVFYIDEVSVIFEYLPGSPKFLEQNDFEINITPTIIKYIFFITVACIFAIGSISFMSSS